MSKNKYVGINGVQCVCTIIFCLVCASVAFIPFALDPMVFSYTSLPIVGDSTAIGRIEPLLRALTDKFSLTATVESIIYLPKISEYLLYAYFGIIAFDIVASFVIFIIRIQVLRKIFRLISVLSGFVMIVVNILFLSSFAGFIINFLASGTMITDIVDEIIDSQALFLLGCTIMSFFLIFRQFKNFKKKFKRIIRGEFHPNGIDDDDDYEDDCDDDNDSDDDDDDDEEDDD